MNMKTLVSSSGLLAVLMMGCAAPSNSTPSASRPAAALPSPSAELLVISAVYGSGTSYADVTYRVNELVHQPGVEFFARPEWLQADPTPGWNKVLVIVYEHRKQRSIFSCGEGGRVNAAILIENAKRN